MARKSRKNLPQPEQAAASVLLPELEEAKIPAAIYGRLSVEDEEKEESMETQIALVQDYINRSSELSYVDTYFDNGFTGTNFKRPAWATKRPERGHYESDSMAVKIGAGDDNPAADPCCVAGKMVCGISASLFGMVFLSAGQCAIGNGDAFVPDAAITGDGSTSNADWWIRDFYDTAGGRQRDRASGTGGSNASAGMVHIK